MTTTNVTRRVSIALSASLLVGASLVAALVPAGADDGDTEEATYQLSCPSGDLASRFHMDPKATELPAAETIEDALEGVVGVQLAPEVYERGRVLRDSGRSAVFGVTSEAGDLIYMVYLQRHQGGYFATGVAQCESFMDMTDDLLDEGA